MTVKGGTTPACAVCKYQRRKCSSTCTLAAYFPANQPQKFQNVHRLFGVSNVTKILDSIHDKSKKDDAMKSIIFEADWRKKLPVNGISGVVNQLRFQIYSAMEELHSLWAQIDACRERLNLPTNYHVNYEMQLESVQAQMNLVGVQEVDNAYFGDLESKEDQFPNGSPIGLSLNETQIAAQGFNRVSRISE